MQNVLSEDEKEGFTITMHTNDRLQALLAMLEQEPNDAFCLYGIAQEHGNSGLHELAIDFYDRAITADESHAYSYFHKARSLEELDRIDDAIITIKAGLACARTHGDTHAASELQGFLDELGG